MILFSYRCKTCESIVSKFERLKWTKCTECGKRANRTYGASVRKRYVKANRNNGGGNLHTQSGLRYENYQDLDRQMDKKCREEGYEVVESAVLRDSHSSKIEALQAETKKAKADGTLNGGMMDSAQRDGAKAIAKDILNV